jgi:hypothetical protein
VAPGTVGYGRAHALVLHCRQQVLQGIHLGDRLAARDGDSILRLASRREQLMDDAADRHRRAAGEPVRLRDMTERYLRRTGDNGAAAQRTALDLEHAPAPRPFDDRSVPQAGHAQQRATVSLRRGERDDRKRASAVQLERRRPEVAGQSQRVVIVDALDNQITGGGVDDPDQLGHGSAASDSDAVFDAALHSRSQLILSGGFLAVWLASEVLHERRHILTRGPDDTLDVHGEVAGFCVQRKLKLGHVQYRTRSLMMLPSVTRSMLPRRRLRTVSQRVPRKQYAAEQGNALPRAFAGRTR